MGQEVHLRVSLLLMVEDPTVQIHHLLLLEACVLTFPEGMPLPGVQREAGAAITYTVQCVSKVGRLQSILQVHGAVVEKIAGSPVSRAGTSHYLPTLRACVVLFLTFVCDIPLSATGWIKMS